MVKYLAKNSYVPFITVFLNKFLDNHPKGFNIDENDSEEKIFDDREGTIYSLLPSNESQDSYYSYDSDDSEDFDRDLDRKLKFITMKDVLPRDRSLSTKILTSGFRERIITESSSLIIESSSFQTTHTKRPANIKDN